MKLSKFLLISKFFLWGLNTRLIGVNKELWFEGKIPKFREALMGRHNECAREAGDAGVAAAYGHIPGGDPRPKNSRRLGS